MKEMNALKTPARFCRLGCLSRLSSRQGAQRGYNIVEMMLVLVVVGLVIGGALVPLQTQYQAAEENEAREYLQNAKQAVLAFALSHKTEATRLQYYDGVIYDMPPGRPYLPCPDINGDGREDRTPINRTAFPLTSVELRNTLGEETDASGVCIELKGMLPWQTLGLPRLDPWGNHLTYRVARQFSSALYGFDETFRADLFARGRRVQYPGGRLTYTPMEFRHEIGAIICTHFVLASGVEVIPSHTPRCPDRDFSNVETGIINNSAAPITLGARLIPPALPLVNDNDAELTGDTGLIDGAAFVILTHGRDGFGAVGRNGVCRAPPRMTGAYIGETVNAYYRNDHPLRDAATFNCQVVDGGNTQQLRGIVFENQFVSRPVSKIVNSAQDQHDDILVWGGSSELIGYLARNGVFPVAKLDYLQAQ